MADTGNTQERGISYWRDAWDQDDIRFHSLAVNKMIQKHNSLLFKQGETQKIFVPLCGKTVDMKWFLDQGQIVIGLDGVKKALDDFIKEHNLDVMEDASCLEQEFQILKTNDGSLKLYCGNVLHFNKSIEGEFDCIWDRGSLVALDQKDVNKYVTVLKDILKPGGKIFVEVFEYDKAMFEESVPLPNSVFEDDLRSLFEPHCTVEMIEKDKLLLTDKEVDLVYYLIVKK